MTGIFSFVRMGLAISLVSTVQEKVWYHSNCPNRGKGCWNTALTDNGGCAIWYNEYEVCVQYLLQWILHSFICEQVTCASMFVG